MAEVVALSRPLRTIFQKRILLSSIAVRVWREGVRNAGVVVSEPGFSFSESVMV
jgi:hypothetical protein